MNTWQGAWYLAKEELRRVRWKHLITLVFIGYLLIFLVPMFSDGRIENSLFGYWALDFITITLLPMLGFMSTQNSGFYWKMDTYTKKLAAWRTMPITIKQIVLGRILLFLVNGIIAMIVFFTIYYLFARSLGADIELLDFILYALFWIGFSIAVGIIYLYLETGFSGMKYFWFCTAISLFLLVGMVVYTYFFKNSLVLLSYRTIAQGGWWMPLIMIVLAIAVFFFGRIIMDKKLRTRSYTS
ncbi:hypothetical protein [Paenibacillus paeoniae]|uniref:ABC transporter permease n=1 Tax=Paenibacillus paeoniae TaxID=2292705 RepID=A0A371P7T7_9BACL|nr:hypothetical protein [Paenibacillus paeoniae]REK71588.1 hypothetical protein DX130_21610 [Paenibacillus paeoniae]